MFSPSSHCFSAIYLHFNWHCENNLPLISRDREEWIHRAISDYAAAIKGVLVHGVGGIEDHVHLILQIEPQREISTLVGKIKGASSHAANRKFGNGALRWQRGYGVVTFAARDLPAVQRYVASQREHHRAGTANPVLENSGTHEGEADRVAEEAAPYGDWRLPFE